MDALNAFLTTVAIWSALIAGGGLGTLAWVWRQGKVWRRWLIGLVLLAVVVCPGLATIAELVINGQFPDYSKQFYTTWGLEFLLGLLTAGVVGEAVRQLLISWQERRQAKERQAEAQLRRQHEQQEKQRRENAAQERQRRVKDKAKNEAEKAAEREARKKEIVRRLKAGELDGPDF